jgi:hypothetical protein
MKPYLHSPIRLRGVMLNQLTYFTTRNYRTSILKASLNKPEEKEEPEFDIGFIMISLKGQQASSATI